MMPIVAGLVCGLCGKRIEDAEDNSHWLTHPFRERMHYWFHSPFLRIGRYVLWADRTGFALINRNKVGENRVLWMWVWKH
jgi:hypothetical protein